MKRGSGLNVAELAVSRFVSSLPSGMGFFSRVECPKVFALPGVRELGAKFSAATVHALEAGLVTGARVGTILGIAGKSKVVYSVVGRISIYVVDIPFRQLPKPVEPSKTMSEVIFVVDADSDMTTSHHGPGLLAGGKTSEIPRRGVVRKSGFKQF